MISSFLFLALVLTLSSSPIASSVPQRLPFIVHESCDSTCRQGVTRRQLKKNCSKGQVERCSDLGTRGLRCTCQEPESGILIVGGESEMLSVLGCTRKRLFIRIDEPFRVGRKTIIWNRPAPGQNVCSACSSAIRKVIRIEETDKFSDIECPSGKTCLLLKTRFARYRDLYGRDLLQGFGLAKMGRKAVEPTFGCDLAAPVQTRKLLPETLVHQISSIPSQCLDWLAADSNGRCTYTDCFLEPGQNPSGCFSCGNNCDNGCGSSTGIGSLVPDQIPALFDFKEPCCKHDHCYSSIFSKKQCDDAFLADLVSSCVPDVNLILFIILPVQRLQQLASCSAIAFLYYSAVSLSSIADDSYKKAQEDQEKHNEKEICSAMCPLLNERGGQGRTTFSVDVRRTSGSFLVQYNMFSIPDELEIRYEGAVLFTTGGLVSGARTFPVSFAGESTIIAVTINAPNDSTAWTVRIDCAEE